MKLLAVAAAPAQVRPDASADAAAAADAADAAEDFEDFFGPLGCK